MIVCCTRPRLSGEADWPHVNNISDDLLQRTDGNASSDRAALKCKCGMPLILEDRYIALKHIGEGGFGCTFLALNFKAGNAQRVLKQFRSEQFIFEAQLMRAQERFQQEAQILEDLHHARIPRVYDLVTLWADSDSRFGAGASQQTGYLYLPQSYIKGEDLQKTLSNRLTQGDTFSEAEVRGMLLQVLDILKYIHTHNPQYIHRDISPSNLIGIHDQLEPHYYLIDFGAVRVEQEIEEMESVAFTESKLYKPGFSPPEQLPGRPQGMTTDPSSDLYSLAATCVYLLTGLRPDYLQIPDNLALWSRKTQVGDGLTNVLNRMLQRNRGDRYQSAQDVIDALNKPVLPLIKPQQQSRFQHWLKPGLAAVGAIAALWAIAQIPPIQCKLFNSCSSEQINSQSSPGTEQPRFSKGDRLLFERQSSPEKMAGIQATAKQDYPAAVDAFTRSLIQNKNDPETLIYLNNARLRAEKRQTYKIGVSVPIGTRDNIAQEILRGAAQAQDEINKSGIANGSSLEIEIADDLNEPAIAKQVAEKFANDPSILAVVGHNTSEVAREAANIYQAKGVVMIAPTMFDAGVAKIGNYIFRAVPTPETMSNRLADYIKTKVFQPKVLICYDSSSPDQSVFRAAFVDALTSRGGQKIVLIDEQGQDQCDYASKFFNPTIAIQKASAQGANAIFLGSNVNRFQPTINLIKANTKHLSLFGSPTLYTQEVVKQSQQAMEGLVIVTPWSPYDYPEFAKRAEDLWGATVNWRTATAYDATRAVIAGLEKSSTRNGLQSVLQARDFSTPGSGDPVQFLESRDRILTPLLMRLENGKFVAMPKSEK